MYYKSKKNMISNEKFYKSLYTGRYINNYILTVNNDDGTVYSTFILHEPDLESMTLLGCVFKNNNKCESVDLRSLIKEFTFKTQLFDFTTLTSKQVNDTFEIILDCLYDNNGDDDKIKYDNRINEQFVVSTISDTFQSNDIYKSDIDSLIAINMQDDDDKSSLNKIQRILTVPDKYCLNCDILFFMIDVLSMDTKKFALSHILKDIMRIYIWDNLRWFVSNNYDFTYTDIMYLKFVGLYSFAALLANKSILFGMILYARQMHDRKSNSIGHKLLKNTFVYNYAIVRNNKIHIIHDKLVDGNDNISLFKNNNETKYTDNIVKYYEIDDIVSITDEIIECVIKQLNEHSETYGDYFLFFNKVFLHKYKWVGIVYWGVRMLKLEQSPSGLILQVNSSKLTDITLKQIVSMPTNKCKDGLIKCFYAMTELLETMCTYPVSDYTEDHFETITSMFLILLTNKIEQLKLFEGQIKLPTVYINVLRDFCKSEDGSLIVNKYLNFTPTLITYFKQSTQYPQYSALLDMTLKRIDECESRIINYVV